MFGGTFFMVHGCICIIYSPVTCYGNYFSKTLTWFFFQFSGSQHLPVSLVWYCQPFPVDTSYNIGTYGNQGVFTIRHVKR